MSIFKSVYSLIFLKGLPPLLFNIKPGVQLNKKNRNETVSYLNKNCRCISSDGIKHMYKSSHYFHADVIKFIGGQNFVYRQLDRVVPIYPSKFRFWGYKDAFTLIVFNMFLDGLQDSERLKMKNKCSLYDQ